MTERQTQVDAELESLGDQLATEIGKRSREWTAVGPTEAKAVIEMARCLREIAVGRVPE